MTDEHAAALVAEACELTERHEHLGALDDEAVADVRLLRAELCRLQTLAPAPACEDVAGAVAELDELLLTVSTRPSPRPAALSA